MFEAEVTQSQARVQEPGVDTATAAGVSAEVQLDAQQQAILNTELNGMLERTGLELENGQQREQLIELLSKLSPEDKANLEELMARKLENGEPALLNTNREGETLLENLHTLATADLVPAAAPHRGKLLSDLILECADPGEFAQGNYGHCVLNVGIEYQLRNNPAEYANLAVELATDGKVELGDGSVMELDPNAFHSSRQDLRTMVAAMVQDSAAEFMGAFNGGLYNDQTEAFFEKLHGTGFVRTDANTPEQIDQAIEELKASDGMNMVSVKWGGNFHANHALRVTEINEEEGYVEFRNPWGKEVMIDGQVNAECVDQEQGIYRMSIEEFRERLNYSMTPKEGAEGITAGAEDSTMITYFEGNPDIVLLESMESEFKTSDTTTESSQGNDTLSALRNIAGRPQEAAQGERANGPGDIHVDSGEMDMDTRRHLSARDSLLNDLMSIRDNALSEG